MASNLRVDNIQPSTAMGIGIGTANGSVTFNADVTGGLNVTSGSVGIGTSNPTQDLEIQDDTLPTVIVRNRTSSSYSRVLLDEVGDSGGAFTINRLGSTSSAIGGARASQIWNHANAPIVFGTNDTEAARFTAAGNRAFVSGNGIDFSATSDGSGTVTAETLSEYEEGSWTPVLASLTGGTQPVVTTSAANGLYTRIGRMVYIEFLMIVTAVTTQGTGNIGVTGLPFSSSGNAYGNNIGITYNDIWDTAFREMYVTGSSLQMIPLGITQSNAYYGTPANDSQAQLSTGYFSVAGWYLRS